MQRETTDEWMSVHVEIDDHWDGDRRSEDRAYLVATGRSLRRGTASPSVAAVEET